MSVGRSALYQLRNVVADGNGTQSGGLLGEEQTAQFYKRGRRRLPIPVSENIMGLWMIQSVQKELTEPYSFAELCKKAEEAKIDSLVECDDDRFLSPASMIKVLQDACREQEKQIPQTPGELARVIYRSLAVCYAKTLQELEEMTGVSYPAIYIVGGGSNADYLNRLTAQAAKRRVYAGPSEATAIGNLTVQMLKTKHGKRCRRQEAASQSRAKSGF